MTQKNSTFRICLVHGCEHTSNTSYIVRGMCKKHYARMQRHGDIEALPKGAKIRYDKLVPIGENIHGRRIQLKMSMSDLAAASGIAAFSITRLCDGVHESRLPTISAIAAALKCDAWQLVRPGTFLLDPNNALD